MEPRVICATVYISVLVTLEFQENKRPRSLLHRIQYARPPTPLTPPPATHHALRARVCVCVYSTIKN